MPRSSVCVDASLVVALVTCEHLSVAALALWRELLYNAVHADFPRIRWLGNYPPEI
jgi:hypothetical protein